MTISVMLAGVGPQVTGSYHIPEILLEICHFLSFLQWLGHRLQAATTYLKFFWKFVIFCHACRGWAAGYRQLPHILKFFQKFVICCHACWGWATGYRQLP